LLARWPSSPIGRPLELAQTAGHALLAILAAAGLILAIRLGYWIFRRQEGIGLGDAKLMAMLGAWLGLRGSLESFILATLAASAAAAIWLGVLTVRRRTEEWSQLPLPLGTFLCLAALVEIFCPLWLLNSTRLGF
jgi:leader peptidase (prepilin peptidase)/N-methyltransferase